LKPPAPMSTRYIEARPHENSFHSLVCSSQRKCNGTVRDPTHS
jgi:hypothetical protein